MRQAIARLAQLVERRTLNLKGAGSIPDASTILPYFNFFLRRRATPRGPAAPWEVKVPSCPGE